MKEFPPFEKLSFYSESETIALPYTTMETDQLTDNEVIARFDEMPRAAERTRYHSDWSWLMPVWYKFKELDGSGSQEQVKAFTLHCSHIEHAILYEGVERACKLLAEGIRWYNSVNQTVKKEQP